MPAFFTGPYQVTGFRRFLPAGRHVVEKLDKKLDVVDRKRSLVQIYTDPGGLRTVAVADVWGQDPGHSDNPWKGM